MEPEKEKLRFYIFTRMKLRDSPMKTRQELQYVYGNLINMTLFADGSPEGRPGISDVPPCLEYQGFQFDPNFLYLLFCSA